MATQLAETRSERVIVLMTPSEKREVSARAVAAGLSLGEYMRLAADMGSIPAAQQAELEALVDELEAATARAERSLAELDAAARQPFDESAIRSRIEAELAERPQADWQALADFLSLAGARSTAGR